MPYLRIWCSRLTADARRTIAQRLTDTLVDLFFKPRSPLTRDDLRERTTVHFIEYGTNEMFIGGRTPQERRQPDVTAELSDWSMSARRQRKIAPALTATLVELFEVPTSAIDNVNIRFHSYPPKDFAVGGILLSDRVPRIAKLMKRIFG